jgi:hypothetical protein
MGMVVAATTLQQRDSNCPEKMSRWFACEVVGCLRTARTRGLCEMHYKRMKYAKCGLLPERPIGGWIGERVKAFRHLKIWKGL